MKFIINLVLVVIIVLLGWMLYDNIREPIAFKRQKEVRELAVINKLKEIRTAQEMYRGVRGSFAGDFDTLNHYLKNGDFMIVNVQGDPDDPNFDPSQIEYDTVYIPAIDSVRSLNLNLDSLRYVPYGGGSTFDIEADTVTYQQTEVNVVEVSVQRKQFMGAYADPRFAKYDNSYDPNSRLKFGNLNAPNTSGNWER